MVFVWDKETDSLISIKQLIGSLCYFEKIKYFIYINLEKMQKTDNLKYFC